MDLPEPVDGRAEAVATVVLVVAVSGAVVTTLEATVLVEVFDVPVPEADVAAACCC